MNDVIYNHLMAHYLMVFNGGLRKLHITYNHIKVTCVYVMTYNHLKSNIFAWYASPKLEQ